MKYLLDHKMKSEHLLAQPNSSKDWGSQFTQRVVLLFRFLIFLQARPQSALFEVTHTEPRHDMELGQSGVQKAVLSNPYFSGKLFLFSHLSLNGSWLVGPLA